MSRRLLVTLFAAWTLCLFTARAAHANAPLRLNCGSTTMVGAFSPDADYSSSSPNSTTASIDIKGVANPAPQAVYQTQNTSASSLTYILPGFTASTPYTVRLHFAELTFNAANSRKMNVSINSVSVLSNFDIYAAAGAKNRAVTRAFATTADSTGKITVVFTAVTGSCCISGIEALTPSVLPADYPLPGWAAGVIPMTGGGSGGQGPSAADSVNLASGVYENDPGADIGARNPLGPSPSFARLYRSKNAYLGYSSPGLSPGWTHNYDVVVQAKFGKSGPLLLTYPNGATEQWALGARATSGPGNLIPPPGAPYLVSGIPASGSSPTGWQSLTMTFKDESRWTFTPGGSTTFRLAQISNLAGRSILVNYDSLNRLSAITDDTHLINPALPANTLLGFSYNFGPTGKLSVAAEYSNPAQPRWINYTYDSSQTLTGVSQIAASGSPNPPLQWQYTYNTLYGQPFLYHVGVPDPTGLSGLLTNTVLYDINGRVQQISDANNNQQVYTYGMNTQVQTLNGTTVSDSGFQNFDSLNRDLGSVDATGHQTSVYYEDPNNLFLPTRLVNRNQQTSLLNYDPTYGNLLTASVPCNGGRLMASYTYDHTDFVAGRLSQVQVGTKTPTTVTYYTNNTVVTVGGVGITQPNGLVKQVLSPRPGTFGATVTTTYVYTALGNVLTITLPGPNGQVTYSYNYTQDGTYSAAEALGEPLTITDPMGHVTHFRYDARGNLIATIDGVGRETDYVYNAADQLVQTLYPMQGANSPGRSYSAYTYLYPGGPIQGTNFYDESGTLFRSVQRTAGKEDEDKAQTGSTEQATFAYDPSYRIKTLTDGNNHSFGHQYDLKGNLTKFSHPLANTSTGFDTTQGTYDNDDNLTQLIDGKNQTFHYTLAADDSRLTDILYPANTLGTSHFNYDQYGRVTSCTDNAGSYAYTYDDLDNVLSVTTTYAGLSAKTILYAYNPDGSRQSMTTPAGVFSYMYDNAGRLIGVVFPWNQSVQYVYDAANRLISQQQFKFTTSYSYDGLDNLLTLTQIANDASQTVLANFTQMTYDAVGNRTFMMTTAQPVNGHDISGPRHWTYDNINHQDQLTNESFTSLNITNPNGDYSSDPADNLTTIRGSSSVSYNADNQLLDLSANYDGNGNPINSFQVDVNDHIISFNLPNARQLLARYSENGLRTNKQLNYIYGGISPPTFFLYDGTHVLCEFSSGQLTACYGYGATGLVQRWATPTSSPGPATYTTYTFDPMGNVVSRFGQNDPPSQPQDLCAFDAYGLLSYYNASVTPGYPAVPPPDPVGYGGQWGNYTDTETGYVLMTYRYYSPTYCRFLTRDPQGYGGGINLYAYVRNNPINRFDPLGLDGDGFQFFVGEAKGIWNWNLGENPFLMPVRMFSGNQELGNLQAVNPDQVDGSSCGYAVAWIAGIFYGGEKQAVIKLANEAKLAKPGEELYVGTFSKSKGWSQTSGLWRWFTAHHAVQAAVSPAKKGQSCNKGITILIPKVVHNRLRTTRGAARQLPSLRHHLAADVRELRGALKDYGYNPKFVNRQLKELIRQNKAMGGFHKP